MSAALDFLCLWGSRYRGIETNANTFQRVYYVGHRAYVGGPPVYDIGCPDLLWGDGEPEAFERLGRPGDAILAARYQRDR